MPALTRSSLFPLPGASLHLDFAGRLAAYRNASGLMQPCQIDDIVTTPRTGNAYTHGLGGLLTPIAAGKLRFRTAPRQGSPRGLLVESAGTNTETSPNTFNSGNWSLVSPMTAVGPFDAGIDGAETGWRLSTTATTTGYLNGHQTIPSTGADWGFYVHVRADNGPATLRVAIIVTDNASATVVNATVDFDAVTGRVIATNDVTGFVDPYSEPGPAGTWRVGAWCSNGGTGVTFGYRLYLPIANSSVVITQASLEQREFPSSVMNGSTRAADLPVASLSGANWFNASEGTWLVDMRYNGSPATTNYLMTMSNSGTPADISLVRQSSGALNLTKSGSVICAAGTMPPHSRQRIGMTYHTAGYWMLGKAGDPSDYTLTENAIQVAGSTNTVPTGLNALNFGHNYGNAPADAEFLSAVYLPRAVTSTELSNMLTS